jgi:membrane protein implicated in regulation of membrane protease activity
MTNDLAPWFWLAAGVLTCAAEALAPGMFLLWIGLAAIATGLTSFVVPLGGEWSLMLFGIYAVVCVIIGRKFYGSRDVASDRPNLNRRADALVGQVFLLEDAIENGEGRARVGDSVWRVHGPDLPKGTRVKVASVEGGVMLQVVAA